MTAVLIRLFVEAGAAEAAEFAERLGHRLGAIARVQATRVRPYWKIPEYQEVFMDASVFGDPAAALPGVTSRLGNGWMQLTDGERM